jgi:SAM-dependent methyltransferase
MRIVAGCVADNSIKYLDQALRLLQSWRWFGGAMADMAFYIAVTGKVDLLYREIFEQYGATVHIVPPFDMRNPTANKLRFLELPIAQDADRVLLLDCDTIIVQEPACLLQDADFLAKIVDAPTVKPEVFAAIFTALDIAIPPYNQRCTVRGEPIIPYFNTGVLSFSRKAMSTIVPEWIRIFKILIERLELFKDQAYYCEQASLSLALAACGTSYTTLSNRLNFPAHFQDEPVASDFGSTDPVIIHYHWLADENGLLQASPYAKVNERIKSFNVRLSQERRRHFDNRVFWDDRYRKNPTLGSGQGSRGLVANYKQGLLRHLVAACRPVTILDVGCGDMFVSQVLPEQGYTGIDVSSVVIVENAARFPQRKFLCGDLDDMDLDKNHLLVCFDLLIHIPDQAKYRRLVKRCVDLVISTGVIAAYEGPPDRPSEITFFHEPISKTLAASGAINIREIGAYHEVRVFRFDKRSYAKPAKVTSADARLKQPIFLVGAMRSGKTSLADLLGRSPHIAHCPSELKDVWSEKGGIPMASPKTRDQVCPECGPADVVSGMKDRLTDAFLSRMTDLQGKKAQAVFLNENPHLCNKLPFVKSLFPDARFIWMHRHLPQVVASIKKLFIDVHNRQSTWFVWPLPSSCVRNRCWSCYYSEDHLSGIRPERIFPGGNVCYLAEYWLESNRAVSDFLPTLAPEDFIAVSQEKFMITPANELARLLGLLEIPYCPDVCNCGELDKHRNDEWKTALDSQELDELIRFVEMRADEIDAVFNFDPPSRRYLKMLGSNRPASTSTRDIWMRTGNTLNKSAAKKVVVVLGMHRSGTSAVAGLLNKLGITLGSSLLAPNEYNEKGFFENSYIFHANENILQTLGSSWDDLSLLEEAWWQRPQLIPHRDAVKKIIYQEFDANELFCIKDPRIAILLPFWISILQELNIEPFFIIPLRHPIEVAESLKAREGFSIEKGLLLWMNNMLSIEYYSRPFIRSFFIFDDFLKFPADIIHRISVKCNIDFPDAKSQIDSIAKEFLDTKLKRHNINDLNFNGDMLSLIDQLHTILFHLNNNSEPDKDDLTAIDEITGEYKRLTSLFYNQDVRNAFLSFKIILADQNVEIADLKQTVAERNGQIADLKQAVTDHNGQGAHITSSNSWKITLPLREARRWLTNPILQAKRYWIEVTKLIRGVCIRLFLF